MLKKISIGMSKVTTLRSIIRFIATVPDNAPRIIDNEEWLKTLDNDTKTIKNNQKLDNHVLLDSRGENNKNLIVHNNFKYKILSTPPISSYINIKASLSNFTSISYLQRNKNYRAQKSNFVDLRIIKCQSGNGGDGMVSFFRDAGRSIGPPDGGDGGDGGNVYIQAIHGINTLSKLQTTYIADNGKNGASDQLDGANGKDVLITVPVGTVVKWCMEPKVISEFINKQLLQKCSGSLKTLLDENMVSMVCTGDFLMDKRPKNIQLFRKSYEPGKGWIFKGKDDAYHQDKDWFQKLSKKVEVYDHELTESELETDRFPLFGIDLDKPTETPICVLKGGKGGLGNMHFLTNLIRNPRFAKKGRSGLEQYLLFELKSLADLGLIGLPNAGKSTILNQISNARPRIGHWAFTTLHPTIGTISLGIDQPNFTVADIPGIIKDASTDKGMGLEFLRHIERSKGWVFVLGLDREDPLEDLNILIHELGGMNKVMAKNILVVCNKADIDCDKPESVQKFLDIKSLCDERNWDIVPISALNGENIDILLEKMARCAEKL